MGYCAAGMPTLEYHVGSLTCAATGASKTTTVMWDDTNNVGACVSFTRLSGKLRYMKLQGTGAAGKTDICAAPTTPTSPSSPLPTAAAATVLAAGALIL